MMNFESSLSKLFNILGSKYKMGDLTFAVIFPVWASLTREESAAGLAGFCNGTMHDNCFGISLLWYCLRG